MKKQKKFDCVDMKNEIQKRMLSEMEGMSNEEMHRYLHERIVDDPKIMAFHRASKPSPSRVGARATSDVEGEPRSA
ncbi:MAG: hypothetical protein KC994_24515 [Candidatus Omnitrophica bacterium]|nr:hypothetical protein [Candidatus Omnitrophota bacterium]MCA9434877.1 hypothetical protein [Candidatus Omnitrophota bacterium]